MIRSLTLTALFITLLAVQFAAQSPNGNGSANSSPTTSEDAEQRTFRPTKSQITQAQEKLKASGAYAGPVDGKYNPDFRSAIKGYQGSKGLEANGKLDEATARSLGIALTDSQLGKPGNKKRGGKAVFRVTKEQVIEAQEMMKRSSGYGGPEDGRYNKEFRTAVREFQSANGLRRTGSLNRATLEKLGIELTEKQKEIPVDPDHFASSESKAGRRIFRATKAQITAVQKMLAELSLYSGEASGKLNPDTRNAIKAWQEQNGTKVTSTLNKETLVAMGIELTDSQSSM